MIDYQSKFDFNLKYLDSTEYDLYHKSLIEFYNKDSVCDISGDGNIVKSNKDGILQIECKKSGYFLKIVDAKYVNINCELNNIRDKKRMLKANIEKLLITDDIKNIKDNFIKIKDKYIDYTKEEDHIKNIFSIQQTKMQDIESNINEIYYELMALFFKRKELFNDISNKKLDYKKKEYIMNFLKSTTKNTIDDTIINNLSLKIKVDKNDTKNWVHWIKSCVKYIYLKLKLQKEYKNKKAQLDKYTLINKYFIINEPSVDKSKNIQVKKGGGMFDDPSSDLQSTVVEEEPHDVVYEEPHDVVSEEPHDVVSEEQQQSGGGIENDEEEYDYQSGRELEVEEDHNDAVSEEEQQHQSVAKMGNNIVIESKKSNIPLHRNHSSIDDTRRHVKNNKHEK